MPPGHARAGDAEALVRVGAEAGADELRHRGPAETGNIVGVNIDKHIASLPEGRREAVQAVHHTVRAAAPAPEAAM